MLGTDVAQIRRQMIVLDCFGVVPLDGISASATLDWFALGTSKLLFLC